MAKKKIASKKGQPEKPSFEASLAALEEIVSKLESGRLELSVSLEQYEEGVRHLKCCYALLQDAEQRIALVSKVDARGNVEASAFDDGEIDDDLSAKGAARAKRRTARDASGENRRSVDDGSSLF